MSTWSVFVDESGALYDLGETACLAGLALRGLPTRQQADQLRARLQAIYPGLPWPLHGNRLQLPAQWARGALLGTYGASDTARHAAALFEAARDPWAQALVATPQSKEAEHDCLVAAGQWLRAQHPKLYWRLEDERIAADRALDVLFLELCHGGNAFAVGIVDPPATDHSAEARYQRVLGGLLERVALILGGNEPPAVLLRTAYFRRGATVGPAPAGMRLTPAKPQHYDANVHPGIVLADLIANRLFRGPMRCKSWLQVAITAQSLAVTIRPPQRPALPPLPTLGAEGLPRTALLGGADADVRAALNRTAPPWHGEQALMWLDALEAP